MTTRTTTPPIRLISAEHGEPRVISNGVLGMSLFVLTEIMLFAGMMGLPVFLRSDEKQKEGGAGPLSPTPPTQPEGPVT